MSAFCIIVISRPFGYVEGQNTLKTSQRGTMPASVMLQILPAGGQSNFALSNFDMIFIGPFVRPRGRRRAVLSVGRNEKNGSASLGDVNSSGHAGGHNSARAWHRALEYQVQSMLHQ